MKLPSMNTVGSFMMNQRTLLCLAVVALAVGQPIASVLLSSLSLGVMVRNWMK